MRPKLAFLLAAIVLTAAGTVRAEHGDCDRCDNDCCEDEKICCPQTVTKTVRESCFEVECKEICIPRFRFPWSKECESRCGRVRTIKVLKRRHYTFEKCVCRWTIESSCPKCGDVHGSGAAGKREPDDDDVVPPPPPAAAASFGSKFRLRLTGTKGGWWSQRFNRTPKKPQLPLIHVVGRPR